MSSIVALKAGDVRYLQGCVKTNEVASAKVPCYAVIVDDNSGSMSGHRQRECIRKTEELIRGCVEALVPYQYAT